MCALFWLVNRLILVVTYQILDCVDVPDAVLYGEKNILLFVRIIIDRMASSPCSVLLLHIHKHIVWLVATQYRFLSNNNHALYLSGIGKLPSNCTNISVSGREFRKLTILFLLIYTYYSGRAPTYLNWLRSFPQTTNNNKSSLSFISSLLCVHFTSLIHTAANLIISFVETFKCFI